MKNIVKMILSLLLILSLFYLCGALFALDITIEDLYTKGAIQSKINEVRGISEVEKYEPTENIEKLIPPEWD